MRPRFSWGTGAGAVALAVAIVCAAGGPLAADGRAARQVRTDGSNRPRTAVAGVREAGRVVATITVLEGTVQIAGVDVELIALDGNVVLAKTITDGQGR